MEQAHVHTIVKPEDYAAARQQLRTDLTRKLVADASVFLILAALMALVLLFVMPSENPRRLELVWMMPLALAVVGVGWSVAQCAYLSIRAIRRLDELEVRTRRGEAVSCEEFDKPTPIRLPSWLKS